MSFSINDLIDQEKKRQKESINLIASENYTSNSIRDATGSILTNKYAEGYPGKRYYGGCAVMDEIERYAIKQCKQLFGAEHANVQPHSGSNANLAVYLSALNHGDTVLAMSLAAGGHLTHGHRMNFSGKLFHIIPYSVNQETELLDYDTIEALAYEHKPKMIVAGASAYSREIDFKRMKSIADAVNAFLFVDMAHIAGLIAAGLHQSPVPYADFVSSTTHKTLRGPRGGFILSRQSHATSIDRSVFPGTQGGPLMHVIAAKAIAFEEAQQPEFVTYQQAVIKNAQTMSQAFKDLGYRIVSGGTDNHLFLIDLKSKQHHGSQPLTGKFVETILESCNIILNRNCIPFDTESPLITSGIRIGTPVMTTRGFGTAEFIQVAHWIDEIISFSDDTQRLAAIKNEVITLCNQYPRPL